MNISFNGSLGTLLLWVLWLVMLLALVVSDIHIAQWIYVVWLFVGLILSSVVFTRKA